MSSTGMMPYLSLHAATICALVACLSPVAHFLSNARIHKLRFGKSQAVAYFEQDPPKFREPVHVIEITVRTYILRYDPPDTIRADKRDKDGTECAVHLVAVTLSLSVKFHVPASCTEKYPVCVAISNASTSFLSGVLFSNP